MSRIYNLASWNVNGIRAAWPKGLSDFLDTGRFDLILLQETKVSDESVLSESILKPAKYQPTFNGSKEKKGYSGTAVFSQPESLKVKNNFGSNILSKEGRMQLVDLGDFFLLNVYFPNGGSGPERLKYKLDFYRQFLNYIKKLQTKKPVIFTGDVNTAHRPIDLARPEANKKTSGFLPEERKWLDKFEATGFVDSFRHLHPQTVRYSWWDMKTRSRDRNVGWRIDYFFVDRRLEKNIQAADILTDQIGSDHAPITLSLKL